MKSANARPSKVWGFHPELESSLVETLCLQLPAVLSSRAISWSIEREFAVGGSIADVVAVVGVSEQQPTLPAPLSVAECVVMSVLRREGAATEEEIALRCGLNGKTKRVLARLSKIGLVKTGRGGRISAVPKWWGPRRILAVEAKLFRWKQALAQAVAYRTYADEVYVALPDAFAAPAISAACEFKAAGVGLLVVSEDRIRKVVAARVSYEHDWRREFVYSRVTSKGRGPSDNGQLAGRPAKGAARTLRC